MIQQRVAFIRAFLKHPIRVASVSETSPRTVQAVLDTVNLAAASCVVELGTGTGPFTEQLVERIGPEARLLAFEISPDLARRLQQRLPDRRLTVINAPAERLLDYVKPHEVDVLISELPLGSMRQPARDALFASIVSALRPDGVMLALQYTTIRRADFRRFFGAVGELRPRAQLWPFTIFSCSRPRVELVGAGQA